MRPAVARAVHAFAAIVVAVTAHVAAAATASGAGDWPMAAHDYASTRYLAARRHQRARTSATLKLAFTFSTGVLRGHEAAPLIVAATTMFIVTPYPNIVYALDLSAAGSAARVEVRAQARSVRAGRRVLRRRQPRRRVRRRQGLPQHARQPDDRARRRQRQGDLALPRGRHPRRRDADDGAARRQGPRADRQQRQRVRRARLARRARRAEAARSSGAPTARDPIATS